MQMQLRIDLAAMMKRSVLIYHSVESHGPEEDDTAT